MHIIQYLDTVNSRLRIYFDCVQFYRNHLQHLRAHLARYQRVMRLTFSSYCCFVRFVVVITCVFSLTACQQQPPHQTTTPIYTPLPIHTNTLPVMQQTTLWTTDFMEFYTSHELARADSYVSFLQTTLAVDNVSVPPLNQLLRSAKRWEACHSEPYALPYHELWRNMPPTITVLNELQRTGVLREFEITSGYRDVALNQCAGGSANSKHMLNAALDIRLLGGQASGEGYTLFRQQLCDFWKTRGVALKMGLGLYADGQIHIDTQGFRTWGVDYTWHTSICGQ